jgi:hypothetical protein
MKSVTEMLFPIDAQAFFNADWTKNARWVSSAPDKWAGVFTARDFCDVIRQLAERRWQDLGLYRLGRSHESGMEAFRSRVTNERPRSVPHVSSLCPEGCTLFVRRISRFHPGLDNFAFALFRELQERVHINAYLSPKGSESGLGSHYDCWDIFVLQIAGRKRWTLYKGGESYPVRKCTFENVDEQQGESCDEIVLEPGGLLYLPRGKWHRATAGGEDSLHLTIGVHCKTGLTFLDWLNRQLERSESIRRNLPLQREEGTSMPDAIRALSDEVRDLLDDEALVSRFLLDSFREEYAEVSSHTGWDRLAGSTVESTARFRWNPRASCRTMADGAFVVAGDKALRLDPLGLRIWSLFEEGSCLQSVAQSIASEYDIGWAEAISDVQTFVESLFSRNFLISESAEIRSTENMSSA